MYSHGSLVHVAVVTCHFVAGVATLAVLGDDGVGWLSIPLVATSALTYATLFHADHVRRRVDIPTFKANVAPLTSRAVALTLLFAACALAATPATFLNPSGWMDLIDNKWVTRMDKDSPAQRLRISAVLSSLSAVLLVATFVVELKLGRWLAHDGLACLTLLATVASGAPAHFAVLGALLLILVNRPSMLVDKSTFASTL